MARQHHRPTLKDAVVRIYSTSGAFFGTGCLTFRGLIVTCAHVVRDALDLAQVTGAEPDGRLVVDFPFLPGKPRSDAEVALGGWGWIDGKEPGDDVAILRLLCSPHLDDVPCFSSADFPPEDRNVITHGFTAAHYADGGTVEARLGSNGLRPSGIYASDGKDSTHLASPGFSGAPIFLANMPSHVGIPMGMISSKPVVAENDPNRLAREANRLMFVVSAYRIREQIDRVLEGAATASARPSDLQLAASFIPAARACLENVRPINSAQQFAQGVSTILRHFEVVASEELDTHNLERLTGLIGNLEHQLRTANEQGFDRKLGLLSLQDFCAELAGFSKKLREYHPDDAERNEVPNGWALQDNQHKLPHADELAALRVAIAERIATLANHTLSVAADVKRRARNALQALEEALDRDPLPLNVIDQVRRELEELDRSVFHELIVASQLLLSRYAAQLPKGAVFRDMREGPEMVVIPAGKFLMGSPNGEDHRSNDEGPQHEVAIPKRLALGRYPITAGEYLHAATMGCCPPPEWHETGPNDHYRTLGDVLTGDNRPIVGVSWNDAQAYAAWLSRATGKTYRLPSEAEWEYGCRAETRTPYYFGDNIAALRDYAWFGVHSSNPVGQKKPNRFGLYDMHGNVSERCEDHWHDNYVDKPDVLKTTGAAWITKGSGARVIRGGEWNDGEPQRLRAAYRTNHAPDFRNNSSGFRLARNL